MADMVSGFLLPDVDDEDSAPFWEGCAKGELRVQACGSCGRLRFPPRPMCPWCRSLAREWKPVSGRGRVWSFVVPHPPLLPAYQDLAPYNVVLVELDDDPSIRLVGNLVEAAGDGGGGARVGAGAINSVDPATITVGEPVQVVFDAADGDVSLPRWTRP